MKYYINTDTEIGTWIYRWDGDNMEYHLNGGWHLSEIFTNPAGELGKEQLIEISYTDVILELL